MPEAAAPSLAQLQQRFQRYLLEGVEHVVEDLGSADRRTRQRRLAIYGHAYALRLEEALRADFRGLHALLGAMEFGRLARDYLQAHPSRYRSIRWFGQELPGYLATAVAWRAQPLAAEMAHFDWALSLALDAADAAPLSLEAISALPAAAWPMLRFRLHPAVQRLSLHWNVVQMRQALLAEDHTAAPHYSQEPVVWLVWRAGLKARYRSLPRAEAWALAAASGGVHFADLCTGLCQWVAPERAALEAATLLKRWVADGLLVGPIAPGEP